VQRRAARVSQVALADRLGLSYHQVQRYEQGVNRISASMLVKIAAILNSSVASLVGETDRPQQPPPSAQNSNGAHALIAAFRQITDVEARRAIMAITQSLAASTDVAVIASAQSLRR
jgi:transcriptional regulator with XRE-family HTH domain